MNPKNLVPNNEYSYLEKNFLIEQMIQEIACGDKNALANLYEYTKVAVYGFSLSILKNVHDAEDTLQEVYIKIHDNAEKYEAKGKPLAWILTITKNLSFMKLRKQKDEIDIDELYIDLEKKESVTHEDRILIEATFKYISDEEREILMLHANTGLKFREIAKILDMPLATVLSKYHRAIKKMKKIIREEDIK